MLIENDLTVTDLVVLREIAMRGQAPAVAQGALRAQGLVACGGEGVLRLTDEGRRLLLRGSPLLWDL